MSVILTAAGQALIAQLQANSGALVIDKFVFANIDGQDSTDAISPTVTMPTDDVVYTFDIPTEFRAFVTPNQVVYSAILGSSVGDFSFNWQGLYCSAHETLVAVATFPTMEKRANDATTNTAGNNLTRNFLLEFAGAQALTEISIDADVWQLDFSVRLTGIDERERLSNRDIYGRMAFVGDGWLLEHSSDAYAFTAGVGYVEGIRIALAEDLTAVPTETPCDVWLDVCLEPSGADVVATVSPLYVTGDATSADYTSSAPYNVKHYCVKIAEIDSDGVVTDLRPKCAEVIGTSLGLASVATVEALRAYTVPTGMISMWSGTTSTIPTGWALCDGTNGTPNLKNRFVVGAGGTYTVGDTGGSTTVSGTVGNTTLTQAQMPTHKHSYNFRGNTVLCQGDGTRSVWYSSTATDSGTTGSSSAHSHTFTGAADSNLPPYYALAYIIKL